MAARYFVGGGTGDWNSTTNWSDTDGGASGFSVPTSVDDVFLTAASGANTLTINVSSQAKTFTCTGFVGTLAGGSAFTVSGNITLGAGMTLTWTGNLVIAANTSMTSAGIVLLGVLVGGATIIHTLVDDWTVGGVLTGGGSSQFNGNNLYISGSLSIGANNNVSGTTIFHLIGTGNWVSSVSTSGNFFCDVIINTAGTITIGSANSIRYGGDLTYTAGTVSVVGNVSIIGSCTFDTDGVVFLTISCSAAMTLTCSSDLTCSSNFSIGAANITYDGSDIYVGGDFSIGGTTQIVQGTSTFIMNGTGVLSSTKSSTGNFRNNLTFNTAGIITVSGNIQYRTGTITYTSGTIITTGSTLNIIANCTLDTDGMTWDGITTNFAAMSVTLNSTVQLSGTWTLGAFDLVLDGTAGFICGTLSMTTNLTVARSLTLLSGVTYTMNTAFTITGPTNVFRYTIKSDTPGTKAIFTLANGATQNVMYTNATDIDSSAGQTIWSFQQVVSNTLNWGNLNVSNIGGGGTFTFVN